MPRPERTLTRHPIRSVLDPLSLPPYSRRRNRDRCPLVIQTQRDNREVRYVLRALGRRCPRNGIRVKASTTSLCSAREDGRPQREIPISTRRPREPGDRPALCVTGSRWEHSGASRVLVAGSCACTGACGCWCMPCRPFFPVTSSTSAFGRECGGGRHGSYLCTPRVHFSRFGHAARRGKQ